MSNQRSYTFNMQSLLMKKQVHKKKNTQRSIYLVNLVKYRIIAL